MNEVLRQGKTLVQHFPFGEVKDVKKKSEVDPEVLFKRGEQLIYEYSMIEKHGTRKDIPDGEALLEISNALLSVRIHLEASGYKDTEPFRALMEKRPNFHRASYMARPNEILSEAKSLLDKNRAKYDYIYHAAAVKDMSYIMMTITRVYDQVKIAEELITAPTLSGAEEYRLALILTDLRKFIRQEKTKASIVGRYKDAPKKMPEKEEAGQVSMF
jgi:hypothetical protein